jgi:16S rRNA processing protein RimM
VESIGQAEVLAGSEIVVPEDALPEPSGDRYAVADLVGCNVTGPGGRVWGVVTDVMESGGAAVLVIDRPGGRETLVPFSAALCPVIDTAGKRITIDPPDGLWDLNEI